MNEKGIWLPQSEAALSLGVGISKFISGYRTHLKAQGEHRKKTYFIPLSMMRPEYQKQYEDKIIEVADDPNVNDALTELNVAGDFDNSLNTLDIQEARRQKIIKETEYLSQKITAKKEQLFNEWSERFFTVFSKNFAKFKNNLINLHLTKDQMKTLNENLDLALQNMKQSLDEIENDYLNEGEASEDDL